MDTMLAVMKNEAAQRAGARPRVFDWHKAARRIREASPKEAGAGLAGDWNYTGGDIFRDGKPVPRKDTYTYLASNWATPELSLDGNEEPCWVYEDESPGWDQNTYWPESALAILDGKEP